MYLGIDIGSSFIKSALLDAGTGEVRDVEKKRAPEFIPNTNPLIKENDPEEIFDLVKRIIDLRAGVLQNIEGVLFSTQMHGFLLTDERGAARTKYVSWQDERCTEKIGGSRETYLDRIRSLLPAEDVKKSGTPVKPSLAMCNLSRLLADFKPAGPLLFCTLGDYVIARLTGRRPVCHLTNAASSGMIDLETRTWNPGIMGKLGFEGISFPEIVPENYPCGVYRAAGRELLLYPAVADHQAAMYGAYVTPGDDLAVNIGTGSQICVVSEDRVYGDYELRPFFDGKYLKSVCHIPAGRALEVLVDFIRDIGSGVYGIEKSGEEVWEKIRAVTDGTRAAGTSGTDLDVSISFFRASAVPYGGAVKNINEENLTLGNLFLGAFGSMARNYRDLYDRRLSTPGRDIRRIVCAGGLPRKFPVLLELIGKEFGLPCGLTPHSEDTLHGLLRIATVL